MNTRDDVASKLIVQGAIIVALAVIIGAFGAHSLKQSLTEYQLIVFETGNRYHFYHGFGILILAALSNHINSKQLRISATLLLIGIILFSGSLYLLASRELLGISSWKFLGPLTPIGGVFFILGWSYLGWTALKSNRIKIQS